MPAAGARRPSDRREHIRGTFDARVQEEWDRYAGEARRILRHDLRQRFLRRHLQGAGATVLELGPGPGRFTPDLRKATRGRVIAVDLSRKGLLESRRRARRRPALGRVDFVQAAGEYLPLASRSVDTAVAFGNIVSFAALEGAALLEELGRVVRRGGRLLLDFPSPAASIQEFFHRAASGRFLPRLLRRPGYYLIDRVLADGYQPLAPARLARWEFRFYTVGQATEELARAGFRTIDVMCVAPIAAHQERIAQVARHERRTWENLLRIEEAIGRRPGVFECGHGFVVAARRR